MTLKSLHRDGMTSVMNPLPPSALIALRRRKIKQTCKSWKATPSACFDGSGKDDGSLEDLSATSRKYSVPASDLTPRLIRSISRTSHSSVALPESMVPFLFVEHLLIQRPHGSTYSRTSRATETQYKRSCVSDDIHATPGCVRKA